MENEEKTAMELAAKENRDKFIEGYKRDPYTTLRDWLLRLLFTLEDRGEGYEASHVEPHILELLLRVEEAFNRTK